jgi:hypothetical protein
LHVTTIKLHPEEFTLKSKFSINNLDCKDNLDCDIHEDTQHSNEHHGWCMSVYTKGKWVSVHLLDRDDINTKMGMIYVVWDT